MAKKTNFHEIFGAISESVVEIGGRIDNAADNINQNTAGAVAGSVIEIGGRIDNATQNINSNTNGAVAQGTAETVAQVRRSESNILAKLTGEKEWWFIILAGILAAACFIGLWILLGHEPFLVDSRDAATNLLLDRVRNPYSIFFALFPSLALFVYLVYVTNLGTAKSNH